MLQKAALLLVSFFFLFVTQGIAMLAEFKTNEHGQVRAVVRFSKNEHIEMQSVTDCKKYEAVVAALEGHPGYPLVKGADDRFKGQNTDRQAAGNPYHLYEVLWSKEEGEPLSIGLVQLGRMPTTEYEENNGLHHPIIQKFMALGVTRQKDSKAGYAKDNIERNENRGAEFVLPFFNPEATLIQRTGALRMCHAFVTECTRRNHLLPVERTLPHVLMALHHPADPILEAFVGAGFVRDDHPGFGWFHPKEGQPDPRVMLTLPIILTSNAAAAAVSAEDIATLGGGEGAANGSAEGTVVANPAAVDK